MASMGGFGVIGHKRSHSDDDPADRTPQHQSVHVKKTRNGHECELRITNRIPPKLHETAADVMVEILNRSKGIVPYIEPAGKETPDCILVKGWHHGLPLDVLVFLYLSHEVVVDARMIYPHDSMGHGHLGYCCWKTACIAMNITIDKGPERPPLPKYLPRHTPLSGVLMENVDQKDVKNMQAIASILDQIFSSSALSFRIRTYAGNYHLDVFGIEGPFTMTHAQLISRIGAIIESDVIKVEESFVYHYKLSHRVLSLFVIKTATITLFKKNVSTVEVEPEPKQQTRQDVTETWRKTIELLNAV